MMRSTLAAALVAVSCLLGACADDDGGTSNPVGSTNDKASQGNLNDAPAAECNLGDTRGCEDNGAVGSQVCAADKSGAGKWGACEPLACETGDIADCTADDGTTGARQCDYDGTWGECGRFTGECKPGDSRSCGNPMIEGMTAPCWLSGGKWQWQYAACNTPLVISFDGAPVTFSQAAGSFDVQGAGVCAATDWVTAATPWLALDRDGNGRIDDGAELFGSMTRLPGGQRAKQGFEALAPLDSDGDGVITPADASWSRLVLWRDVNQDRVSQPGELRGLDAEGIVAIDLAFRMVPHCEVGGSCEGERGGVRWRDAGGHERTGAVIDVRLADR